MPEHQVQQQVMNLSFYGFAGLQSWTPIWLVIERLDGILFFVWGKKDFDVIVSFHHRCHPNAMLDMQNYDLNLNGSFKHLDMRSPKRWYSTKTERIILKQNRNFSFDGSINAGMLNFFGDGFKFSYDNFRIDMEVIDSMRLQVQTGDRLLQAAQLACRHAAPLRY